MCKVQAVSLAKEMFFLQINLSESRFIIQKQLIDWSMGRVIFGGGKCHKCQQLLSRTHAIECSRAKEILQPLRPFLDIYDTRSIRKYHQHLSQDSQMDLLEIKKSEND